MDEEVKKAPSEVYILMNGDGNVLYGVSVGDPTTSVRGACCVRYVLPAAPASSSVEVETLAAVSSRLLAMTREPGQLGTVYDGFWSARNMVNAMLAEARARQPQPAPLPCGECGAAVVPTCTRCGERFMTAEERERVPPQPAPAREHGGVIMAEALSDIVVWLVDEAERARRGGAK